MSKVELLQGDCLELMRDLPDNSVDLILCDLPYGTTACKWDSVIPFEPLWEQYRRIAKKNAAIVLTASQPFTTALIASNMKDFRYCWVWDKANASTGLHAKVQPLRVHEDVVVFGGRGRYFPVMQEAKPRVDKARSIPNGQAFNGECVSRVYDNGGKSFPKSIIRMSNANQRGKVHPTQKPVALMEYMIRTYTQEGETVLDNCMGSGTTGVACANTGRKFIGMEMDAKYFDIASSRIEQASKANRS